MLIDCWLLNVQWQIFQSELIIDNKDMEFWSNHREDKLNKDIDHSRYSRASKR